MRMKTNPGKLKGELYYYSIRLIALYPHVLKPCSKFKQSRCFKPALKNYQAVQLDYINLKPMSEFHT
jgi:hypothetical protein